MTETRVAVDVLVDQLLEIIPEDQVDLRAALTTVIKPWWNISPELRMNDCYWKPIGQVLEEKVGEIDADWKIKARDLYNGGGL